MKRLIALSAFLITAFICLSCTTKPGTADEKFIYIIARPNATVNQSSNCFFSTVIKHSSNCIKDESPYEFFTKAGKLFFADIAKKYNLMIEDWILEFVGDDVDRHPIPGLSNYFVTKDKAENARAADIKKHSNKTGGKYELIESPHTYNCD
jgi:hypothetical protein